MPSISFLLESQSPLCPPTSSPPLTFSASFPLLGPFQTGTREATWGADPLEYYGGFHSLHPSPITSFPSSLTANGTVTWSSLVASVSCPSPSSTRADLLVRFPDVGWESMKSVYGWAALQYQAWARGSLTVTGDTERTVVLYTDHVLEFWVDDERYFGGDFYAFRRAPLVLHLQPGEHRVDVRIVRDVRVMGGVGEPTVDIALEAEISGGGLQFGVRTLVLPDLVGGRLAGTLGSVDLRNDEREWIDVLEVQSVNDAFIVRKEDNRSFRLAPGQTRRLAFTVAVSKVPSDHLSLLIAYRSRSSPEVFHSPLITHVFQPQNLGEPHKITYRHPGGVVSYSILRPPSEEALHHVDPKGCLPVVLGLHGASVETDSDQIRHAFAGAPNLRAWLLFPSGVTPWSADDWHRWGFADVEAALAAIPEWIERMGWQGACVDTQRWLVTGHSNGGQGAWYALTHNPDRIIGVAPISGYSSIQAYVPYHFWHEADPRITAVIQSSLSDYRHELLLGNSCGVPVHQQHGGLDDNVPPSHSRRLSLLLRQAGCPSEYVELPGQGHYFDGVMTTQSLLGFYSRILENPATENPEVSIFEFVVANPASTGSKKGIVVDQLMSSGTPGRVKAEYNADTKTWLFQTSNIRRLHFVSDSKRNWTLSKMVIDGNDIKLVGNVAMSDQWLVRLDTGSWTISHDHQWLRDQRHGRQYGGLNAILEPAGRLVISTPDEAYRLALQVSRNLVQYFGADVEIDVTHHKLMPSKRPNTIVLLLGTMTNMNRRAEDPGPISIDQKTGLVVRDFHGRSAVYEFHEGLGVIFLRCKEAGRLDLVVWGVDLSGLQYAARLIPVLTGIGQPDFVVVSKSCAWKGAAAVHALGYFDDFWNLTDDSVIL